MIITFESKESSVLSSNISYSVTIISFQCALKCPKVKFSGLFYISLSLLKVNPCNGCFDKARCKILVKLLKYLSCSLTVRLNFFKGRIFNKNINLALGRKQIRALEFLLKLGSYQWGILQLVLDEVCISQPKLCIIFCFYTSTHGSLIKQFGSLRLLLWYLEVDVFHPFYSLCLLRRGTQYILFKSCPFLHFALSDWRYRCLDVVDEIVLVSFKIVCD